MRELSNYYLILLISQMAKNSSDQENHSQPFHLYDIFLSDTYFWMMMYLSCLRIVLMPHMSHKFEYFILSFHSLETSHLFSFYNSENVVSVFYIHQDYFTGMCIHSESENYYHFLFLILTNKSCPLSELSFI